MTDDINNHMAELIEYDGYVHVKPPLKSICKNCKYSYITKTELRCNLDGMEINKFAVVFNRLCSGGGG